MKGEGGWRDSRASVAGVGGGAVSREPCKEQASVECTAHGVRPGRWWLPGTNAHPQQHQQQRQQQHFSW